MIPQKTDVVIVGAGPTGLALALGLQQAGIDYLLIDKLPQPLNTSRAGVIHAHTLEMLDQLGVTTELVGRGLKVTDFVIAIFIGEGGAFLWIGSLSRFAAPAKAAAAGSVAAPDGGISYRQRRLLRFCEPANGHAGQDYPIGKPRTGLSRHGACPQLRVAD